MITKNEELKIRIQFRSISKIRRSKTLHHLKILIPDQTQLWIHFHYRIISSVLPYNQTDINPSHISDCIRANKKDNKQKTQAVQFVTCKSFSELLRILFCRRNTWRDFKSCHYSLCSYLWMCVFWSFWVRVFMFVGLRGYEWRWWGWERKSRLIHVSAVIEFLYWRSAHFVRVTLPFLFLVMSGLALFVFG